jgi:hypothetical protein
MVRCMQSYSLWVCSCPALGTGSSWPMMFPRRTCGSRICNSGYSIAPELDKTLVGGHSCILHRPPHANALTGDSLGWCLVTTAFGASSKTYQMPPETPEHYAKIVQLHRLRKRLELELACPRTSKDGYEGVAIQQTLPRSFFRVRVRVLASRCGPPTPTRRCSC